MSSEQQWSIQLVPRISTKTGEFDGQKDGKPTAFKKMWIDENNETHLPTFRAETV